MIQGLRRAGLLCLPGTIWSTQGKEDRSMLNASASLLVYALMSKRYLILYIFSHIRNFGINKITIVSQLVEQEATNCTFLLYHLNVDYLLERIHSLSLMIKS